MPDVLQGPKPFDELNEAIPSTDDRVGAYAREHQPD